MPVSAVPAAGVTETATVEAASAAVETTAAMEAASAVESAAATVKSAAAAMEAAAPAVKASTPMMLSIGGGRQCDGTGGEAAGNEQRMQFHRALQAR